MFSLARAHDAFDGDGAIASESLADRFGRTVEGFMDLVEAAKHCPCAKKAWFEFLGEEPDPAIDRAE